MIHVQLKERQLNLELVLRNILWLLGDKIVIFIIKKDFLKKGFDVFLHRFKIIGIVCDYFYFSN